MSSQLLERVRDWNPHSFPLRNISASLTFLILSISNCLFFFWNSKSSVNSFTLGLIYAIKIWMFKNPIPSFSYIKILPSPDLLKLNWVKLPMMSIFLLKYYLNLSWFAQYSGWHALQTPAFLRDWPDSSHLERCHFQDIIVTELKQLLWKSNMILSTNIFFIFLYFSLHITNIIKIHGNY